MDRVQDAEKTEEDNYELSLRPKYLREYIGQKDVKENIDVYEVTNINASHLGDALGETAGWYNDYANFLDSMFQSYWFVRGGAYSYGYGSGIFCFGRDDGSINNRHAFRTVLSVTE